MLQVSALSYRMMKPISMFLAAVQSESEGQKRRQRFNQGATISDEAAKPGFGSLKAALSAVCANYDVCSQFATQ